jgi:hypothetical protein
MLTALRPRRRRLDRRNGVSGAWLLQFNQGRVKVSKVQSRSLRKYQQYALTDERGREKGNAMGTAATEAAARGVVEKRKSTRAGECALVLTDVTKSECGRIRSENRGRLFFSWPWPRSRGPERVCVEGRRWQRKIPRAPAAWQHSVTDDLINSHRTKQGRRSVRRVIICIICERSVHHC